MLFYNCRVFNWKSNLNVHMRTHDGNRVRNCVCTEPNCGKRFYDQQHLKQHMLTHKKGEHVDAMMNVLCRHIHAHILIVLKNIPLQEV